ncbi:MAG: hypothetical protein U0H79_08615 [Eubacterium sp.]|nr:hypothetical protein [Eubacterium sp.]
MKTINPLLTRELVTLGYQGENEYKRVVFDISDWIRTEGAGGDVLLFFKRPDETVPYPCEIEVDGDKVYWVITAAELNIAGIGEAELQYRTGRNIVKSKSIKFRIKESLTEVDDIQGTWVEKVLKVYDDIFNTGEEGQQLSKSAEGVEWTDPQGLKKRSIDDGATLILANNAEYRGADIASLEVQYPDGDFECWMRFTTAAEGSISIIFPEDTAYIGEQPEYGNNETWEISIKDGVAVALEVG